MIVSPQHAASTKRRGPEHARHRANHPVMRGIALVVIGGLVTLGAGAATAYTRLQNNITSANIDHLLGDDRPAEPTPDPTDPNAGSQVNILILGSDAREGNEQFAADDVDGQRPDTTILAHISADRSRVEMVSIPRDSIVDIPECQRSDGTVSPPRPQEMFNAAFDFGAQSGEESDGAACTLKTVEALTGVYVHHFVVVDMTGFVNMVDALEGVPMCIPHYINSPKADLELQPGNQVFDGRTALGFARARTGVGLGDGSDTGRIARQQELLAATARAVLGKNLLTDVPELIRFLNATTRSLTVSSGLSGIPDMAGLGFSLRGISPEDIVFLTVPFGPAPFDSNRVVWTHEADIVWQNLIDDVPVTRGLVPEGEPDDDTDPSGAGQNDADSGVQPAPVRTPGVEPFTGADQTSICG